MPSPCTPADLFARLSELGIVTRTLEHPPVFTVEQVMQATQLGNRRFPAGITRFLIPGRVLNLNADLAVLRSDQSLPEKNRWLHAMLQERQQAGAIRYYGEPVYLLDDY